jgi:ATP-dependent DNA ligase
LPHEKAKKTPLVYYAFDLLFLDGADLRSRPLIERRELLATLLKKAPPNIRFSEALSGTREELLKVAHQFQLEGLIAKGPDSLYEAGRRSGAWVKVKLTQQQEFCYWRLHPGRRQPQILRRSTGRLPRPGRPLVRRQSRNGFLRESLAGVRALPLRL